MIKKLLLQFAAFALVLTTAVTVLAENPDETFTIDYQVLNSDTDSVSIANDYFDKPATLFVENGEKYIQFSVNHSGWVKELQAPAGEAFVDVDIVSEDEVEDTRTVRFKLEKDLSEPVEFNMHIMIESMEPIYDHRYTVRFDFDDAQKEEIESKVRDSIEDVNSDEEEDVVATETTGTDNEQQDEKAEKNGGKTIVLIVIVLAMAALLITRPWKTKKN